MTTENELLVQVKAESWDGPVFSIFFWSIKLIRKVISLGSCKYERLFNYLLTIIECYLVFYFVSKQVNAKESMTLILAVSCHSHFSF